MSKKILVLYGTQTGNSQDVAKRIGREAKRYGLQPTVQSLHSYDVLNLPMESGIVVFVVATTGQGDVPDRMKAFWRFLFRKSLQTGSLKDVQFAVFGLGDSAYVKFNVVAKKLHNRLCSLGAQNVIDRGLGDDQHDEGYEGALNPWLVALWDKLSMQLALDPPLDVGLGEHPFCIDVIADGQIPLPTKDVNWFKDSIEAMRRFTQVHTESATCGILCSILME